MTNFADSQDRWQGRSMIATRYGVAATEQPLASQAAVQILQHGGNAVDAAIAANAVMGLVSPNSNGIGGDLFAIVYEAKTGKLYGLNASGWAPQQLTIDFLKSKNLNAKSSDGTPRMPDRGIHTITVPGAVEGWWKLHSRFAKLPLAELLKPAILYAEEGFPVTEVTANAWALATDLMKRHPPASATYYPNGRAPKTGEVFKNPDLASSLRQIAAGGRDAYYKGDIARRILALSQEMGGLLSADDLASYQAEWIDTISTSYRGWTVHELPPNGQGIAALEMLNIMENFPIGQQEHYSAARLHTLIEAKKLAYADMLRYVGDPRQSKIPVEGILSKDFAKERAKLIDSAKANCRVPAGKPPAPGSDTTYLAVVDKDGNMVSLIQSNYEGFGSGLVAPGTGFGLHNRGALFNLDSGSPNALAGHKRPLHTIIPAFMAKGDIRVAFGIMGGWNQSQAHAQFVSNMVDHGMNIQQALDAARFTKPTFDGCDLQIESRVPDIARLRLIQMGHRLEVRGDYFSGMGAGQAVMRDFSTGVNFGASDPRKDGAAIPEQPPHK